MTALSYTCPNCGRADCQVEPLRIAAETRETNGRAEQRATSDCANAVRLARAEKARALYGEYPLTWPGFDGRIV